MRHDATFHIIARIFIALDIHLSFRASVYFKFENANIPLLQSERSTLLKALSIDVNTIELLDFNPIDHAKVSADHAHTRPEQVASAAGAEMVRGG